jgi:hypothetical protein
MGEQLSILGDCIDAVQSSRRGRLLLIGGEAGEHAMRCSLLDRSGPSSTSPRARAVSSRGSWRPERDRSRYGRADARVVVADLSCPVS